MKKFLLVLLICGCAEARANIQAETGIPLYLSATADAGRPPKLEVHFSPKGGCTDEIVSLINSAKTEILVQAYSFTSPTIIGALKNRAHPDAGKPISVKVILDRSNNSNQAIQDLQSNGVMVQIDAKHSIAHNKVIIIDKKVVFTGSFNFTQQAETSNAENCLTVRDAGLAKQYGANWDLHSSHSVISGVDGGITK